jgi:hypothetical protein
MKTTNFVKECFKLIWISLFESVSDPNSYLGYNTIVNESKKEKSKKNKPKKMPTIISF